MLAIVIFQSINPQQNHWEKYISHKQAPVFYLLENDIPLAILHQWQQLFWKPLRISEKIKPSQEQLIREYLDLIAQFNELNGHHLLWWATFISSKNRLNSPMLSYLQELQNILYAIQSLPKEATLILMNISWSVVEAVKSIARIEKISFRVFASPLARTKEYWKNKYLFWRQFFAEVYHASLSVWKTKKAFSKHTSLNQTTPVYLIKSFTYAKNFQKARYIDPFFGNLVKYLTSNLSLPILTIALGFQDKETCYANMEKLVEQEVHPLESYLTYWDIVQQTFQWLIQLTFSPFQSPKTATWMKYDITSSLQHWVQNGGFQFSFFQSLHFQSAKRLGKEYNIQYSLITYEGRPWERFFIAGLRTSNPKVHITGCQHAVLPLAATDMFLHPREASTIPLPNQIITTGIITKKILEKYGAYPQERILIGCALRFEALQHLALLPRNNKEYQPNIHFELLVAFGGSAEEIPLLNYAFAQAIENEEVMFQMRTHPAFPFDQLLEKSLWKNEDLPHNLVESNKTSLIDALQACDALLYWGTTVSLEALMIGKPIIQFDRGDLFNYDPLFEFQEFKWQVGKHTPIAPIIQEIQQIPKEQYAEMQRQGREYIQNYFYSVTPERISSFFPD